MKFLVIFLISTVALVVADRPKQPSPEDIKALIEKGIKMTDMTCENYEAVCNKVFNTKQAIEAGMKEHMINGCVSIVKQYLCEGKKEGEDFAAVYDEVIELMKKSG